MIQKPVNQHIDLPLLHKYGVQLFIKREDLLHPFISGNKYRKLKYNLFEAREKGYEQLITFGGAYSNHIAAAAAAGREYRFSTVGVIRGEELLNCVADNPTLRFAQEQGMNFHFVSREAYRRKTEADFTAMLKERYGEFYLLPEGGTNELAVKGCEEILTAEDADFDIVCCAVGTGGTISGIINSLKGGQKVLGFPALKGEFLKDEILRFANKPDWELIHDYHFGGYAKIDAKLVDFINSFKLSTGVPLDPVYTGKMLFGILEMVKQGYFKEGTKILAIHTGGLQGIAGMNIKLKKKNLPEIL